MSKTVDERVVEMRFDNSQFEKNVSTTMSTLDKFKQKLNLSGASKGLDEINSSAKKVDMSVLGNGIETVKAKFSALQVMGVTALANLTNSAVNAGRRMVSALSLDPIKDGFAEYETQMNAVQTILANTQKEGTTVKTVNAALDELNHYADKTIYNFTEMTRNIGTFTAAGVKLDTSVSSIKGIANLAAVSGSTSQQASTAMYQLSQAIASGTVKLMDWNSVVNAGMGGQVFQDALIRTSEHLKTGAKSAISAEGSFRDSLQTGWLTTEVLTQTLDQFATAADTQEEYEAAVEKFVKQGYTKEEAKQMADMAKTAGEAATKVKTFSQLIDTLKEALGSGWTETWRLIIGDFEEARELWTSVSDVLSDLINKSSEARNNMIKGWADLGGRTALIETFKNAFEAICKIIKPISEAFREIFPRTTSEQLYKMTDALRKFSERLIISDSTAAKLKSTFKGVFSILDIGVEALKAIGEGILSLFKGFSGLELGILDATSSFGDFMSDLRDSIKETDFFGKAVDKVVKFVSNAIDKIKEFGKSLKIGFKAPEFDSVLSFFKSLWSIITKVTSVIANALGKVGSTISEVLGKGDIFEVLNSGVLVGILLGVKNFVSTIGDAFDNVGGFVENVKGILDDVRGCLQAYQEQLKAGALLKIAAAIAILAGALFLLSTIDPNSLGSAIVAITVLFTELVGAMALLNKFGGKSSMFDSTAVKMVAMSVAILILASALKSLSGLNWEQMGVGLTAISVLLWELVAVSIVMSKTGSKMIKGSVGLVALAAAMKILASACKDFAAMSWEEMFKGISAIGLLLLELSIFENIAGKAKHIVRTGLSMVLIAASMKIFASALSDLGSMDWNTIVKGLTAMGLALAELSIAMNLMPKGSVLKATGLVIAVASLKLLANAMSDFGGMEWSSIGKGLATIGIALAELAIGLNLMRGTVAGSAALLVAVAALAIMVPIIKSIGSMSWEEIAKGLITLAGAFAILGVAGLLLQPLIVPILALAGAFVLLGVGMVGIGAGLLLVSAGIAALCASLAAGATAIVAGLTVIVTGVLELIPTIARIIGEGIVEIAKVIGEYAPQLAESCLLLIEGVLEALAEHAPAITDALLDFLIGVINSLADHMPALIEALVNLLSKLFEGVAAAMKDLDPGVLRNAISAAIGLSALLLAISVALKILGSISIGNALKGAIALTVMAVPLVAFVGVLALMSNIDNAMNNALALVVLTGSLTIMLGVLTIIGAAWPAAAAGLIALTAMAIPMLAFIGILALMNCVDNAMSNALLLGAFMSIMADVLVKISLVAPLALIGVVAMSGLAALMGVIGTFAVAVGALMDKFPSLQDFLDSGLPVLEQLAGSIGTMIGKFVGGFGEGLSDSLVNMGENIAEFMARLAEASDNASGIKGESFDGVKKLMDVMGSIALTTVGTTIGDIFTLGGTSMEKFETDGVAFFNAMKAIGEASSDIDINESAMNSVIGVAKNLAELQSSLEPIGGVVTWFVGRDDLSTFGENAAQFVSSMSTVFGSLDDTSFNTEAMDQIVAAATGLAKLQSSLEPIGGVVTWFVGRDDLGTFGENAALFVSSMNTAFGSLDGTSFNTEAMDSIIASATSLAKLQSSLEPIGGVVTWFVGRDDLGAFGENIAQFIASISTAMSSLNGTEFNTEAMDQIITAATSLAKLQSSLEPIGGVVTWFVGRDDLGKFGTSVAEFISSMRTAMTSLGGETFNEEAFASVIMAATKLSELQSKLEPMGGVVTWFSGRDDLGEFGTNISLFADAMRKLKTGMGEDGISETVVSSVTNAGKAIIALQKALPEEHWFDGKMNLTEFSNYISDFATAMSDFGAKAASINPEAISTAITTAYRIKSLINSLNNLDTSGLTTFTGIGTGGFGADGAAYQIAQTIAAYSEKVATINTEAVSVSVSAALKLKTLISNLANLDTSGISNFKPNSIAIEMKNYADKVGGINTTAVASSITSASRLKTFIASLAGLDNIGISKFKPGSIGSALKAYGASVAGVNMSAISRSISVATRIKTFITSLAGLDASGVKAYKDAINTLAETNVSDLVKAFKGASEKMNSAGADLVGSLAKGMTSKMGAVSAAISGISVSVSTALTNVRAYYVSFYDVGAYLVTGFCNGISANTFRAAAQASAMASAAEQAARSALKINSPSKVFKEIGSGIPEGFAMGIGMLDRDVKNSVTDMAASAITSTRSAMTTVLDALNGDIDAQPTIRPVIDLTNVRDGANSIRSLLGGANTVGVRADLNAISSTMNRRIQNGTTDDVISAINKLNDGLANNRGDTYNFGDFTYDDGSNISDAVQTLVRAARMGRRV